MKQDSKIRVGIVPLVFALALTVVSPGVIGQGQGQETAIIKDLHFRIEFKRIVPSEVTIAEGDYFLRIESAAYVSGLDVQLDNGQGQNLKRSLPKGSVR